MNVATAVDKITPLHLACLGGFLPLAEYLLESGASHSALTAQHKSPLHYALAYGHVDIAVALVKHGADLGIEDIHGVSPLSLIKHGGTISADDALRSFGVTQEAVKTIERPLHPSYPASAPSAARDNGGWPVERLNGFEEDMHCDVDQYDIDDIGGVDLFEKYIAHQRPVLLRAGKYFAQNWPSLVHYSRGVLLAEHGHENVTVSSIPYSGNDLTRRYIMSCVC